jgi:uncharacterized protein YjbI with pentapeptide repeats
VNSNEVPHLLIDAVNSASMAARTAWLGFLALTAYLFIAVAGINHTDLLTNAPVALPLLQVNISLDQFFLFAPLVYVFFHFGVLVQHVALAQKIELLNGFFEKSELDGAIPTHPGRFELHPYFITQAVAGPSRGSLIGLMLDYMTWLSLAIIPIILLLYFQTAFLPYHDQASTWAHRAFLIMDLVLISLTGVYFAAPLRSFWSAVLYSILEFPLRIFISLLVNLAAVAFAFLVATIPDSELDKFASRELKWSTPLPGVERSAFVPTAYLFEGEVDQITGQNSALFSRNLIVTDADLVPEDRGQDGEVSLNLRGRDLRYATLDRSDLHGADLTGATLREASLSGIRLQGALLVGADLRGAKFWRLGEEDADFTPARLSWANFRRAKMQGANLHASIAHGANFSKAELTGAVLLAAQLQGADFQHANLTAANLTGADLEATRFAGAKLFAANFSQTRAAAADFQGAWLIGTDFSGAELAGADVRQGMIWMSTPPQTADNLDARFRMLVPPRDSIRQAIEQSVAALDDPDLKMKVQGRVSALLKKDSEENWKASRQANQWQQILDNADWNETEKIATTDFLADLACADLTTGRAVANAIGRRAGTVLLFQPTFNGDVARLFDRLTSNSCDGASEKLKPDVLQDLRRAAQLVARAPTNPFALPQ